jgi:hypothetical protein
MTASVYLLMQRQANKIVNAEFLKIHYNYFSNKLYHTCFGNVHLPSLVVNIIIKKAVKFK